MKRIFDVSPGFITIDKMAAPTNSVVIADMIIFIFKRLKPKKKKDK